MRKPDSLRTAIVAAVPELARDAQALKIWFDKGKLAAIAGAGPRGWEYRYQLSLFMMDYAGDPDLVFNAVLDWVQIEQPELLLDPKRPDDPIRFQAEILDDMKVDLLIELDLTEAVQAFAVDGGYELRHLAEPLLDDDTPLVAGAPPLTCIEGDGPDPE